MYIILTQCFPSRLGGIESLVSNLALNLGESGEVLVLADRHNFFQDSIFDIKNQDKITIRRYGGIKFFRRRKKVKELDYIIKSKKVEYVIADTWKSIELCADNLIRNKIPIICLAHGNELLANIEKKKKRIVSNLSKSSIIIANSKFTSNLVNELINDEKKIKVVYPGANDLRSIESDKSLIINGHPILLTLSRLEKRKGHVLILRAINKLIKIFPNIKYVIAGEGEEKKNLINFVNINKLNNNVIFVGNVNDKQKKQLFDHTKLMIMPTLDESENRSIEGFGIAYIEAAFFGIPSIASNVGGTPEAVINDNTGIIINKDEDLFKVLENLLSNEKKLIDLGEKAKERAINSFTWEKVARKYILAIKNNN